MEIQELTFIIKEDIANLNKQIAQLQQVRVVSIILSSWTDIVEVKIQKLSGIYFVGSVTMYRGPEVVSSIPRLTHQVYQNTFS